MILCLLDSTPIFLSSEQPGKPWKSLSCVQLFVTPWTVAHQASLYMGFPRQEYWSGLPVPSPGELPNQGIEPRSPALQDHSSNQMSYFVSSVLGFFFSHFCNFVIWLVNLFSDQRVPEAIFVEWVSTVWQKMLETIVEHHQCSWMHGEQY